MKAELDWVYCRFNEQVARYNCVAEPRPAIYRQQEVIVRGSPLSVTSEGGFEPGNRFSYKYTRLQSSVIDIATVVIYPVSGIHRIPVFVLEMVVVGESIHVAVIDVEPLAGFNEGDQRILQAFGHLHATYTELLPNASELPEWFREICSPIHLFGKASAADLPVYEKAFREYLERYLQTFIDSQQEPLPCEEAPAVMAYKKHHYQHSPAKKVMSRFEDDWFEIFLGDYHFGPARFVPQTLSARLSIETQRQHRTTEGVRLLGFYRRPPGDYSEYRKVLLGFHLVHSTLESRFPELLGASASGMQLSRRCRRELLEKDLAALGSGAGKLIAQYTHVLPPVPVMKSTEQAVGFLYVLEGSTLGAKVVTRALMARGWDERALHYYRAYGDNTVGLWRTFQSCIDQMSLNQEQVIASARRLFQYFAELFDALDSFDSFDSFDSPGKHEFQLVFDEVQGSE